MPTFSINGVFVTRNSFDETTSASPVTLDVVMPAGDTTFSYSVISTFPGDLPEVYFSVNDIAASLSGANVPADFTTDNDNVSAYLGTAFTTQGNFVALTFEAPRFGGGLNEAIFPIGGAVPPLPTNLAEFGALESTFIRGDTATGAFAPGQAIDFNSLENTTVQAGPNLITGTEGDDFLEGTPADDNIITGDATPNGDLVVGSAGNDTIDMTGMNQNDGAVGLRYNVIGSGIDVTINGATNTGTIDKGALGSDTLLGVENPMFSGWTLGGVGLGGTDFDDSFNITLDDLQWMSIRPGEGLDTYNINTSVSQRLEPSDSVGALRLDMRFAGGIDVNLGTGVIADDGYGNVEQIQGNAPVWEVYGSAANDRFVGSDNAESFRSTGGNDSLDGGAGFDRLRYDTPQIASVNIDAQAGVATGTLNDGGTFTDSFVNFEHLRGSNGNDMIFSDGALASHYGLEVANQVYRIYQATLDREPDVQGHHRWTSELASGQSSLQDVADGFVRSPQFKQIYSDNLSDGGFVTLLYNNVLGRDPDAQGFARWTGELADGASRAEVVLGFSQSPQFVNETNPQASAFARDSAASSWSDDVFRLYQATLDRTPDAQGHDRWTGELAGGQSTLEEVADGFVRSPQFRQTFSDDLSDGDFVTLLYNNVLGRTPDAQGFARWTGELADGASRAEVVLGFSQSPQFETETAAGLKQWMRDQGTDDRIEAGPGNDLVAGGQYADAFVFGPNEAGRTTVVDLEPWDVIDLSGFGYGSAAEARAQMSQQDGDLLFSDQGSEALFRSTALSEITDDMILV